MAVPLLRRAHPRYLVHKIVSYTHGGKDFLTLTVDLGLGGMRINTHFPLPKDEFLNFRLVLGHCHTMKVEEVWAL